MAHVPVFTEFEMCCVDGASERGCVLVRESDGIAAADHTYRVIDVRDAHNGVVVVPTNSVDRNS
jgi:hypothetical protein